MNSIVLSNGYGSTYPHDMAYEKVERAILRSPGNRLLHKVEIIGLDGLAYQELSNKNRPMGITVVVLIKHFLMHYGNHESILRRHM